MDDTISVLDDFLPSDSYENLNRLVSGEPIANWSRSTIGADPIGYWSRNFIPTGRYNLADVSCLLEEARELRALHVAWRLLKNAKLADTVLTGCYLIGYPFGSEGYASDDPDRIGDYAALLYMNDNWEPNWAGATAFLDQHDQTVKSVLPKRNRLVIFPAHLRHAGKSVSRKCTAFRRTLIFSTRKRRTAKFEKLSGFLRKNGALNYKHRKGTLHDHLVRTFSILESQGVEDEVCFGGGLHAIYGTNAFRHSTMTRADRLTIVGEFGEQAEQLAYLFSIIDRPKTLEFPVELSSDTAVVECNDKQRLKLQRKIFDDLRRIECANIADHGLLDNHSILSQTWVILTNPKGAG
jgi:hypothetical protein